MSISTSITTFARAASTSFMVAYVVVLMFFSLENTMLLPIKPITLYYKNTRGSLEELEIAWKPMSYTLALQSFFYNTIFPFKYKISGILRLTWLVIHALITLIKNYMGGKPMLYYMGAKSLLYFLVYVKLNNIAIFLNKTILRS